MQIFNKFDTGAPPPTPQNVTAVAISPTRIAVSWMYTNLSAIESFVITAETGLGILLVAKMKCLKA